MANYTPAAYGSLGQMDPFLAEAQNRFNGRLFIAPEDRPYNYELYPGEHNIQPVNVGVIDHIIQPSAVANAFFNANNVTTIQNAIREKIKKISNGQYNIGRQSDSQLIIIMRSIYLQYGKNMPSDIYNQITELNNMVIDECVRIIIPNIQQYMGYLKDISSPPPVMPLPVTTNNTGNKLIDTTKLFYTQSPVYNNM